eukprot:CAMPEP_0179201396 /NCGR_PEP_ID=MMETSP0796-20121207/100232_1 /TAXON_ID=73915 /ORGANISM="Pyrodinium bahamense, Strain pbaha01" /LENGTH=305 /DNA_ID=CAMNT_0020905953 /DNA_START=127 /DNA_END=1040 /DNA_ORIENTATION=-
MNSARAVNTRHALASSGGELQSDFSKGDVRLTVSTLSSDVHALDDAATSLPLGVEVRVYDAPALDSVLTPHGPDCVALATDVLLRALQAQPWERVDPKEQPAGSSGLALAPQARPGQHCAPVHRGRYHHDVLAKLVDQHHGYEVAGGAPQLPAAIAAEAVPEGLQGLAAKLGAGLQLAAVAAARGACAKPLSHGASSISRSEKTREASSPWKQATSSCVGCASRGAAGGPKPRSRAEAAVVPLPLLAPHFGERWFIDSEHDVQGSPILIPAVPVSGMGKSRMLTIRYLWRRRQAGASEKAAGSRR